MHWVDDAAQRRAMVDAMLAWGTDYHFVYIDIAGTGLLVGEAERQGKLVVSTELGGGGHVTAATHRISQSGLANVLRHVGVLSGDVRTPDTTPVIGRATPRSTTTCSRPRRACGRRSSTSATASRQGSRVGQMHFLERPDREPAVVEALTDGIVFVVRAIATTAQGDNVAVIAREVDAKELY